MKSKFLNLILLLSSSFSLLLAQEFPVGGENLILSEKLKNTKVDNEFGKIEMANAENTLALTATTIKQPKFVYNLSLRFPLQTRNIVPDQPLLLTFQARTLESSKETEEAKVAWIFRQTESSAPKDVIEKSVSLSSKWQTYYLPFKALKTSNATDVLAMHFGFTPQKFDIKNIQLLLYPVGFDFAKLPKTKITYAGMASNSKWRIEAEKRIEEIRKGYFSLSVNFKGKPIKNASISIQQKKHYFRFGTAVSTVDINTNPKYLETVEKLFNIVVFENDLKAKAWSNLNKQPATIDAINTLKSDGILVKGHALLWPGFQYLPEVYFENKNNPDKIKQLIDSHFKSILSQTKGKISHWDVVNEAYTNKDISTIFGSNEILFEAFRKAKSFDPNAKRYINEYGILSGGGINRTKQDWYFNFIKAIDSKTNGAIDGLGMQSHIGTDLTPPTTVIEVLNRFSTLNKEIAISEFSIDILDDDDLRAQYTRDFMIAAFSIPAVKEYLFWGFYAPRHPKAALVDENYTLTKMGKAYRDLVFDTWNTKWEGKTNEKGEMAHRGFYGDYEYSLQYEGKEYKGTFALTPNDLTAIKINLK
jgi:GH35 family endo-1,4-beta-xylanase